MDCIDLRPFGLDTVSNELSPAVAIQDLEKKCGHAVNSICFAEHLDSLDPLSQFRRKFSVPLARDLPCVDTAKVQEDEECLYFCGNSLGLKPKKADDYMKQELEDWGKSGVFMHFSGLFPAALCDTYAKTPLASLVGAAEETEVAAMNGLTVNLHLLMVHFYRPSKERFKILIEDHAFPSDRYAVVSQLQLHNINPDEGLLVVTPRKGEHTIRHEDIVDLLEKEGSSIALVMLSGVQYYTGQKFDMRRVTEAARSHGCMVGWDLAHAVGNVRLRLHEWDVDFAAWCSYKYLNSGAGGISGIFVHKRHHASNSHPRLAGWWSNAQSTRFEMRKHLDAAEGAEAFRLCNPPPWLIAPHMASLGIFQESSESERLAKQYLLTGYLELLLKKELGDEVEIITPSVPSDRGCQLSLIFKHELSQVHKHLEAEGVVCDVRLPSAMRIAPVPLYNTFQDVLKFVETLKRVLSMVGSL